MCIFQREQRIMKPCRLIYGRCKEASFGESRKGYVPDAAVCNIMSTSCAGSDHVTFLAGLPFHKYFLHWLVSFRQAMWNLCLHSARHLSRTTFNYPRHGYSRRLSSIPGAAIPKPKSLHPPRRLRKLARKTGFTLVGLGTVYMVDKTYNASSIFRNLRTLWTVRHHIQ